ncbi:MAG: hypothetical protein LBO79_05225 [Zoogloeaceae bacterium]|nr:hypothetical protein [Zoogloeaceae bacterium]
MPTVAYPGSGRSPKGSYSYEFTPMDNVRGIEIQAVDGSNVCPGIRIYYGGENKVLNGLKPVLNLSPGFGGVKENGMPLYQLGHPGGLDGDATAGSIVWGCNASYLTTTFFDRLARYLPSRCRYRGNASH